MCEGRQESWRHGADILPIEPAGVVKGSVQEFKHHTQPIWALRIPIAHCMTCAVKACDDKRTMTGPGGCHQHILARLLLVMEERKKSRKPVYMTSRRPCAIFPYAKVHFAVSDHLGRRNLGGPQTLCVPVTTVTIRRSENIENVFSSSPALRQII